MGRFPVPMAFSQMSSRGYRAYHGRTYPYFYVSQIFGHCAINQWSNGALHFPLAFHEENILFKVYDTVPSIKPPCCLTALSKWLNFLSRKKQLNKNNVIIHRQTGRQKYRHHIKLKRLQNILNYTTLNGGHLTHPRSGAQVGTRAQRSRKIRMTMTQERRPLALAWENKLDRDMHLTV